MLKNVGIAGKLAVLVLLPMLGLAYFAGSKVLDKADTASGAARLQQDTRLAVRGERLRARGRRRSAVMTALFVGSKGAKSASELKDQRALTDGRLAEPAGAREERGRAVAGKLAAALEPLATLAEHRSAVDALSLPGAEATGYYTQVNAAMLDVVSAVADSSQRAGADPRRRGVRELPARQGADRARARRARQGLHGRDVPGRRRDRQVPERGRRPGHPAAGVRAPGDAGGRARGRLRRQRPGRRGGGAVARAGHLAAARKPTWAAPIPTPGSRR